MSLKNKQKQKPGTRLINLWSNLEKDSIPDKHIITIDNY